MRARYTITRWPSSRSRPNGACNRATHFLREKYKNDRTLFRTVPPTISVVLYESCGVHRARGLDVTITAVAVVICVPKRILPRFSLFFRPYARRLCGPCLGDTLRLWSSIDKQHSKHLRKFFRVAKNDFFLIVFRKQ